MALKLQSADLHRILADASLGPNEIHQAYNALDSAVTLRVHSRLSALLAQSPHASTSYSFVRAMQGPAMDMMNRGVAIQQKVRADETLRYTQIRDRAQSILDTFANAVWGPERYVERTKSTEVFTPTGKRGQPLTPRTRTVVTERIAERP